MLSSKSTVVLYSREQHLITERDPQPTATMVHVTPKWYVCDRLKVGICDASLFWAPTIDVELTLEKERRVFVSVKLYTSRKRIWPSKYRETTIKHQSQKTARPSTQPTELHNHGCSANAAKGKHSRNGQKMQMQQKGHYAVICQLRQQSWVRQWDHSWPLRHKRLRHFDAITPALLTHNTCAYQNTYQYRTHWHISKPLLHRMLYGHPFKTS